MEFAGQYACDGPEHEGARSIPKGQECFEVAGFEQPREQGGTNHLELRKRTGVVWCRSCVDLAKLKAAHGGVPGTLL